MADPTFRAYSTSQARAYGAARTSYTTALYDAILDHHLSSGGKRDLLLDVGCGPGNATRDLAVHFDRAVGADPGAEMIETAKELGGKSGLGDEVAFLQRGAEDCEQAAEPGSVSLLTAAMAASRLTSSI
jgi:trans-aconitate 3-methyltransferase